jgi:signal transduction histidine kinase/ligand-binding sensor domain-containing protein
MHRTDLSKRTIGRLLSILATVAFALEGARSQRAPLQLNQLSHRTWTLADGAPAQMARIAVAKDGTLWLGTGSGLFHFDGVHFKRFEPAPGDPGLPEIEVGNVFVGSDGTLWISFYGNYRVAALRDGHLRIYTASSGLPSDGTKKFLQAPNGTMWILGRTKLYYLAGDHWVQQPLDKLLPLESGGEYRTVFFDSKGTEWLVSGENIFFLLQGEKRFQLLPSIIDPETGAAQIWRILEAPDGSIWADIRTLKTNHDVIRRILDPKGRPTSTPSIPSEYAGGGSLIDEMGSVWVANGPSGLLKADIRPLADRDGEIQQQPEVQILTSKFDRTDGLTPGAVSNMIDDKRGNIWIVDDGGLNRFSVPTFTRFTDQELNYTVGVASCPDGTVWLASELSSIISIKNGISVSHGDKRSVENIFCDANNTFWFTDQAGLWTYADGAFHAIPYPANTPPSPVHRITGENQHHLYLGMRMSGPYGGVWLFSDGQWTHLSDQYSRALLEDSKGELWEEDATGNVFSLKNSHTSAHPFDTSAGLGVINVFYESRRGIMAGGTRGIAILRNGRFHQLATMDPNASLGISGILESGKGDLWLNGTLGFVHIASSEVEAALLSPNYRMATEAFGGGDGILGPASQSNLLPSAVADTSGRFWFANASSAAYIDPDQPRSLPQKPVMMVTGVSSEGSLLSGHELTVPPRSHTLRIGYFGVDMNRPDRVTYRYKLDGVDRDWVDAGTRTEAVYTTLRPGKYTFHSAASNIAGSWVDAAPLTFRVLPAFYQTMWFAIVCAVASLIAIWFFLALRIKFVADQVQRGADERAEERMRIARDLHDTLLQGIQLLTLRFQVVAQKLPNGDETREMLDSALTSADNVLSEGRERVRTLRTSGRESGDLLVSLTSVGSELNWRTPTEADYEVEGNPIRLSSVAYEELFNIGREALTNAFQHAKAGRIQLRIEYAPNYLKLCCRDDGCGIDERVLAEGTTGHWGLLGLRERATNIAGTLSIESKKNIGTTITVTVPSAVAYDRPGRFKWFSNLWGRQRLASYNRLRN